MSRQFVNVQIIFMDEAPSKEKRNSTHCLKCQIAIQENERLRIARDLHDSLGQQLAAVKLYQSTMFTLNSNPQLAKVFVKSNEALQSTLSELRSICFGLMPATLETYGLCAALDELCNKIELRELIVLSIPKEVDLSFLNKTFEISLFRIIQECLSNSIKHSNATLIEIKLQVNRNLELLELVITDNGLGFDINTINPMQGMGLSNISTRVKAHSGQMKIFSSINIGTTLNFHFPLNQEQSRGVVI